MVGGWWFVVGGSWLVVRGWWLVVGGSWLVVRGWWLVVGGSWLVVGGSWLASCSMSMSPVDVDVLVLVTSSRPNHRPMQLRYEAELHWKLKLFLKIPTCSPIAK